MKREPIQTMSPIMIRSQAQVDLACARIRHLPMDEIHPVEVVIREQLKKRKMSLNDMMWAGPLKDIETYGRVHGVQYKAEVWHEHFKELFLPDENSADFDPTHVLEGYQKWGVNPWTGSRVLTGTTTKLTDKGMRHYIQQMEAEAATEYGVTFTEPEPRGY